MDSGGTAKSISYRPLKFPDVQILRGKKIVGINTGVGKKWPPRKFSDEKLLLVIQQIQKHYRVVLLGGPEEHFLNMEMASQTEATYFGVFPMRKFIGLTSLCDLIVTPVTMATHVALRLGEKLLF